jgi:hypothetical protein
MRRRTTYYLLIVFAGGLCVAFLIRCLHRTALDDYQRIRLGMCAQEVETVIGRPRDPMPKRRLILEALVSRGESFKDPMPEGDLSQGDLGYKNCDIGYWYDTTGVATVGFDEHGLVVWKYFMRLPQPSLIDQLRAIWDSPFHGRRP